MLVKYELRERDCGLCSSNCVSVKTVCCENRSDARHLGQMVSKAGGYKGTSLSSSAVQCVAGTPGYLTSSDRFSGLAK